MTVEVRTIQYMDSGRNYGEGIPMSPECCDRKLSSESVQRTDKNKKLICHKEDRSGTINTADRSGTKQMSCLAKYNKHQKRLVRQKLCQILRQSDIILHQSDIILQKTKELLSLSVMEGSV